ncbi:sensor histidine kinase [Brumimicrobium salinarum]
MEERYLLQEMNPILLKQAFTNLLSNAISYSEINQAKVKFIVDRQKQLIIQLINTGTPISKEEEQYLFRHFFRGKNSKNKTGHGLGLILTKRIIDIHKAKITF